MPILTMLVDQLGECRPATPADSRLLTRKLTARAGAPYRSLPRRADYLVALCAETGVSVTFTPAAGSSPPPPRSRSRTPAPSPNGRHHR